MSDKVKPWHQRKPKHGERDKRISPLQPGGDKRISPLRISDEEEAEDCPQQDQRNQKWTEG